LRRRDGGRTCRAGQWIDRDLVGFLKPPFNVRYDIAVVRDASGKIRLARKLL
jgi:hypothetical protein